LEEMRGSHFEIEGVGRGGSGERGELGR